MKIRFFAQLEAVTGTAEYDLAVSHPLRAGELWEKLETIFPGLAEWRGSTRLACNRTYAGAEARFSDADEIALIPPVSGG